MKIRRIMQINFQSVNFNAKSNLLSYADKKLSKLSHYYEKIISADVFMKLDNSNEKNNKLIEIKLNIPGQALVVKKNGRSFEECVDLSENSLRKMIKRKKEKQLSY